MENQNILNVTAAQRRHLTPPCLSEKDICLLLIAFLCPTPDSELQAAFLELPASGLERHILQRQPEKETFPVAPGQLAGRRIRSPALCCSEAPPLRRAGRATVAPEAKRTSEPEDPFWTSIYSFLRPTLTPHLSSICSSNLTSAKEAKQ